MALADYNEIFQVSKKKLHITICIYRRMEYGTESKINHMLADIWKELESERSNYESISVSYVYETESLMAVKEVGLLEEGMKPMFPEVCGGGKNHSLNHVFYMGMAILKRQKVKKENAEYRLYLVTDEKFLRTDKLLWEKEGKLSWNPAYETLHARVILYKSKNAGDPRVEDFIRGKSGGSVVVY